MALVYVSVGSNIDRYRYISASLDELSQFFGELILSSVYESVAIGFEGDNFLNLVVGFKCELSLAELSQCLRDIEYSHGRLPNAPKFSARTLDIDILTYDDWVSEFSGVSLPRAEITENAFVLLPLSEVAGDDIHPVENKTYAELWKAYDQRRQQFWVVDFQWGGRSISLAVG